MERSFNRAGTETPLLRPTSPISGFIPRPSLDLDILFRPVAGGLAEYCGWLTCAGTEALCVGEDPSEAYIRAAVMYAGRKRRKPVQRA